MRQLPDWISGYLKYTDNSEPPKQFKVWTAVSVIAACLRRKCKLEWGFSTFYPNMYIVLVGPSGCRKNTALDPGKDLLRELGIKLAAEAITREALVRELANSTTEVRLGEDGNILERHSSLTVFSPELTVFLGYENRTLMSDLTDWFDCTSPWTYRTKNAGEDEIQGTWVNLIGGTTPSLLGATLTHDAIGGGLTSRMVFVYGDKKSKLVPLPFLTKIEKDVREKLVSDLREISKMHGRFRITEEFMEAWKEWYVRHEIDLPFDDTRFEPYFSRRPTHLLKLCMIVCASRTNEMLITLDDLNRAKSILEDAELRMQSAFGGVGGAKHVQVSNLIMRTIEREGDVMFSSLMKRFQHEVDREELAGIIATLKAARFCEIEVEGADHRIVKVR